jgi:hypothetical protein
MKLAEALLLRADLQKKLASLRERAVANAVVQHGDEPRGIAGCRKEPERYGVREIKWVATPKVASLQKQADDLAKNVRELNATIQQTNWQAELIE